jgi:hypothetical protein
MAGENPFDWPLIRAEKVIIIKEASNSERKGEGVSYKWIEDKGIEKISEAQHGNWSREKRQ